MAVVQGKAVDVAPATIQITWPALANGDTGAFQACPNLRNMTVQVYGTQGVGGAVTMQGSPDGAAVGTLHSSGSDLVIGTLDWAEPWPIDENPVYLRPNVTAGDGTTSVTVVVTGTLKN